MKSNNSSPSMTEPSFSSAATAQKGSTVVLPSDFQFERTYGSNYHTFTSISPHGRGRTWARPHAPAHLYGRARNQFRPVPPASVLWRDVAEKYTLHLESYARVNRDTQLTNRPSAAVLIHAMSCPTPISAREKYAHAPQNIRRDTAATPDYAHTCRQSITPVIMKNGLRVIWGSLGNHLRILMVKFTCNFRTIKVRRSLDQLIIRNITIQ